VTLMTFRFSDHADQELKNRHISVSLVLGVLTNPQQKAPEMPGIMCYQSLVDFGGGKTYLLRVMVNETVDPAVVVTAYRTSKIKKYWRTE
jgi:hypothetical protein